MTGAVVLFSGGQDSTTCLAWAIERWGNEGVYPVSFDYGQRHSVELQQAQTITEIFGCKPPEVIPLEAFRWIGSAALTNPNIEVEVQASQKSLNTWAYEHGLPSTFIPGRNLTFFMLGVSYGAFLGLRDLVTGVCEADRSGYPDCREEFVDSAQDAISLAVDDNIEIHAPLVKLTKAKTFKMAEDLGVLNVVINHSHTCYHGDRSRSFPWGAGCGECPACQERARGWEEYKEMAGVV